MKLPFLSARPAHTLLYITEAKTFRINTDRRGVIQGEVEVIDVRCDTSNGIPSALEHIIENSPILGKKLWVLYARLSTYVLNLPSVQVSGVEDAILEQALLFEYESLTGQSVAHSQLAYTFVSEVDEMSSYWVNLIAKETFTKVGEVLKKARCKLGGISHPGGLPFLVSGDDASSWLRIEAWSNTFFALTKNPETGFSMSVLLPEQNKNWQDELDHWIVDTGDVEKSESIINNKIEYLPETNESYHLTLDGALIFWMGLWADYLVNTNDPAVPLLNVRRKINMDLVYMLGGGSLALALCVGHFTWNLYLRNDYEYEVTQLTAAEKDIKAARAGVNKSRDETAKIQEKLKLLRNNVTVIPTAMSALQRRPMDLLSGLSKHTPEDLIIESIGVDTKLHIVIKGVSLQSQLINQLASNVQADFADLGWRVNVPTKTDLLAFSEGGPWEFSLVLVDEGLAGFVKTK